MTKQAQTIDALTTLRAAIEAAQEEWTGLDWETDLTVGNWDDAYSAEALAAAKADEREAIAASAEQASEHGAAAIERAAAGDWDGCVAELEAAERIERDYGDSPTWRPVLRMAESLRDEAVRS